MGKQLLLLGHPIKQIDDIRLQRRCAATELRKRLSRQWLDSQSRQQAQAALQRICRWCTP